MVYEINRESLANQGSSSFEFNIVAQKVSQILEIKWLADGTQ